MRNTAGLRYSDKGVRGIILEAVIALSVLGKSNNFTVSGRAVSVNGRASIFGAT